MTAVLNSMPPLVQTVLSRFQEEGFKPVTPDILQPANVFLDLVGENIRRRLFLTNGADGTDLCLRPDFTIPVCRLHLASGTSAREKSYCYYGPVFRQRTDGSGENYHLGAESIGRNDTQTADADMVRLSIDALTTFGINDIDVRIGDEALFTAVLSGLNLPTVWQRRLRDLFGEKDKLFEAIHRMAGQQQPCDETRKTRTGFLSALEGADPEAAHTVIEDLLSIAGISAVGGRTASEIAERFLEQAALANGIGSDTKAADTLKRYLDICGSAVAAVEDLETFAKETGIDLSLPLKNFKTRLDALSSKGIPAEKITFDAAFGRRLDYYSGFVFEIHKTGSTENAQLVGGGRYDRLVKLLGAEKEVPAVGFSIWLDRVMTAQEQGTCA